MLEPEYPQPGELLRIRGATQESAVRAQELHVRLAQSLVRLLPAGTLFTLNQHGGYGQALSVWDGNSSIEGVFGRRYSLCAPVAEGGVVPNFLHWTNVPVHIAPHGVTFQA